MLLEKELIEANLYNLTNIEFGLRYNIIIIKGPVGTLGLNALLQEYVSKDVFLSESSIFFGKFKMF